MNETPLRFIKNARSGKFDVDGNKIGTTDPYFSATASGFAKK